MKIIKPYTVVDWFIDEVNLLKKIEKVGRVCYKSEDKITDESCIKFIGDIIKRGHESVLEHGSIILQLSVFRYLYLLMFHHKFFNFTFQYWRPIISGNIRAFRDFKREHKNNQWIGKLINFLANNYPALFNDLKDNHGIAKAKILDEGNLIYDKEMYEHITRSVKFVCDRGVSHELVRHRVASFSQESTRYCNYSQDKFYNEITVIKPCFWDEGTDKYNEWLSGCEFSEKQYFKLLELGATPQEARDVLTNSLKTELFMTMNLRGWHNFFTLRLPPSAHPQMRELTIPLFRAFKQIFPFTFRNIKEEKN